MLFSLLVLSVENKKAGQPRPFNRLNNHCQYIRGQRSETIPLGGLQIAGRHLARLHVALQIVSDLLTFNDFAHSSAFDRRNMDESVSSAIIRLDETEALS